MCNSCATMKTKPVRRRLRRLAAALAVIAVLSAAPPALADSAPFADVSTSHWAYDEIMEAYNDGAVGGTGYADNGLRIYDPNGKVTMAQFIAILTRAFHPEDVENVTSSIAYNNPGYSWRSWW